VLGLGFWPAAEEREHLRTVKVHVGGSDFGEEAHVMFERRGLVIL
jgi:hypothetical protein